MYFKEIKLKATTPEQAATEITYEIASARVDGIELLRINILQNIGIDAGISDKKMNRVIIRTLKNMKQDGRIQFYATADSFKAYRTEAIFLQNKYPELFLSLPTVIEGEDFIFLKL